MRVLPLLAALAVVATTPAMAEVKTFARASGWEAFGGTTNDGTAVCGVSVDSDGSFFMLKYFKGDDVLTVQLGDDGWKGKVGDKVSVSMKFDRQSPWRATATAYKAGSGTMALQFTVPSKVVDDWMDEFKMSQNLILVFPDSNLDDWNADLTGTKIIGENMEKCMGWMSGD